MSQSCPTVVSNVPKLSPSSLKVVLQTSKTNLAETTKTGWVVISETGRLRRRGESKEGAGSPEQGTWTTICVIMISSLSLSLSLSHHYLREQRRSRLSGAGHVDNHLAFYHCLYQCHYQYHPQGKVALSSLSLSLFGIINGIIIIMFDNDIIYRERWWSKANQTIRIEFFDPCSLFSHLEVWPKIEDLLDQQLKQLAFPGNIGLRSIDS